MPERAPHLAATVLQRAKVAVADTVCHPVIGHAVGRLFRNRIPNRGIIIDTSAAAVSPRVKAQLLFGLYERAEIGFIRHYLDGDLDVIELGASLGVTGSHILSRLGPGRRLVSVEANPALVPVIERAFSRYPDAPATVEHAAISYGDGPALLRLGATTQGSRLEDASLRDDVVQVRRTTLSALLDAHDIGRFALVSDIEGAELDIFEHDAAALSRCDRMVIELHPNATSSVADLRAMLVDGHGFRLLAERGPVLALGR